MPTAPASRAAHWAAVHIAMRHVTTVQDRHLPAMRDALSAATLADAAGETDARAAEFARFRSHHDALTDAKRHLERTLTHALAAEDDAARRHAPIVPRAAQAAVMYVDPVTARRW